MDKLREILELHTNEIISANSTISLLEKDMLFVNRAQDQHDYKVMQTLSSVQKMYSSDPLDIILEKEKIQELTRAFLDLLNTMPERYKLLLQLYVIDGIHLKRCADIMCIKYPAVYVYIKAIQKRIMKQYYKNPEIKRIVDLMKEYQTVD